MRKTIFTISILISAVAFSETLTGTAKNKKGETVYIEKHNIEKDESGFIKSIRVEYSRPEGLVFATMTSVFSKNKTVPDTTFEDTRFASNSSMRIVDRKVEFEEFRKDKSVSKKTISLEEKMVASQGFDNFIKLNSAKLAKEPVDFKFGVLEKQDFYSLTGYKKASASSQEIEYGIRASSWLLRFFAGELVVVYDSKTMRLKSFKGRSNVLDESGKSQDVVIDYQWSE